MTITIDERTTPADAERIRRNIYDAVRELQLLPAASARRIEGVELVDGKPTPIAHGLGRRAFVTPSPPRGAAAAGRIDEIRDGSYNPAEYVVLKATGYGATITVDLEVK
ncbi:MAG TPA: hypothetical protein VLT45_07780 [Kofleriaceae bacterium]|nr:hypothetical protein [Kofleriaceae bacterium]